MEFIICSQDFHVSNQSDGFSNLPGGGPESHAERLFSGWKEYITVSDQPFLFSFFDKMTDCTVTGRVIWNYQKCAYEIQAVFLSKEDLALVDTPFLLLDCISDNSDPTAATSPEEELRTMEPVLRGFPDLLCKLVCDMNPAGGRARRLSAFIFDKPENGLSWLNTMIAFQIPSVWSKYLIVACDEPRRHLFDNLFARYGCEYGSICFCALDYYGGGESFSEYIVDAWNHKYIGASRTNEKLSSDVSQTISLVNADNGYNLGLLNRMKLCVDQAGNLLELHELLTLFLLLFDHKQGEDRELAVICEKLKNRWRRAYNNGLESILLDAVMDRPGLSPEVTCEFVNLFYRSLDTDTDKWNVMNRLAANMIHAAVSGNEYLFEAYQNAVVRLPEDSATKLNYELTSDKSIQMLNTSLTLYTPEMASLILSMLLHAIDDVCGNTLKNMVSRRNLVNLVLSLVQILFSPRADLETALSRSPMIGPDLLCCVGMLYYLEHEAEGNQLKAIQQSLCAAATHLDQAETTFAIHFLCYQKDPFALKIAEQILQDRYRSKKIQATEFAPLYSALLSSSVGSDAGNKPLQAILDDFDTNPSRSEIFLETILRHLKKNNPEYFSELTDHLITFSFEMARESMKGQTSEQKVSFLYQWMAKTSKDIIDPNRVLDQQKIGKITYAVKNPAFLLRFLRLIMKNYCHQLPRFDIRNYHFFLEDVKRILYEVLSADSFSSRDLYGVFYATEIELIFTDYMKYVNHSGSSIHMLIDISFNLLGEDANFIKEWIQRLPKNGEAETAIANMMYDVWVSKYNMFSRPEADEVCINCWNEVPNSRFSFGQRYLEERYNSLNDFLKNHPNDLSPNNPCLYIEAVWDLFSAAIPNTPKGGDYKQLTYRWISYSDYGRPNDFDRMVQKIAHTPHLGFLCQNSSRWQLCLLGKALHRTESLHNWQECVKYYRQVKILPVPFAPQGICTKDLLIEILRELTKSSSHDELLHLIPFIWDVRNYPYNYIWQYVYDVFCLVKEAYQNPRDNRYDIFNALIEYAFAGKEYSEEVKKHLPDMILRETDIAFVQSLKTVILSKKKLGGIASYWGNEKKKIIEQWFRQ